MKIGDTVGPNRVGLSGTHRSTEDLCGTVVAIDGKRVTLVNNRGGHRNVSIDQIQVNPRVPVHNPQFSVETR
jgi:hypothetical protein